MSISEFEWESVPSELPSSNVARSAPAPSNPIPDKRRLHRVRDVRREQGVSIKRAAQLMRKSVEQLRLEEDEAVDLRLSQIYEWQRLLEVPVSDLLVEPHAPLSAPVLRRAQLVRLMKTAQAIIERSTQTSVQRLAQTLTSQLLEIMPELEGVTPWHSLDRPTENQNSRILEQTYLHDRPPEPR